MLDEMLRFFAAFREQKPSARFLFISREAPHSIRAAASQVGIEAHELIIRSADRIEVPKLLAAANFGISFIRPTFSKIASSPTKLGEMLAIGLPMVVNAGVGDVDAVIADTKAGVVVESFEPSVLAAAAAKLTGPQPSPEAIREGAMRWFRLDQAIESYDEIYRSIAADRP